MKNSNLYPFAVGNKLEDRNTYFYVPFNGQEFINSWIADRNKILSILKQESKFIEFNSEGKIIEITYPVCTSTLLSFLMNSLMEKMELEEIHQITKKLLQRFEVTKRIHTAYPENLHAHAKTPYDDLSLYVKFATLLQEAYKDNPKLYYLSGLIKIIDTLCAMVADLNQIEKSTLMLLINFEKESVDLLMQKIEGNNKSC
jgi:methionyl-tRNA formyltransferase